VFGLFFAPFTILFELNLALNFFLVFTTPVVDALTILASQFNEKILGHIIYFLALQI